MDYPFGHHHHHHHHANDGDGNEEDRRPPHFFPTGDGPEGFYPPPGVRHVSHQPDPQYNAPPPFYESPPPQYNAPPPFFESPPPPRHPAYGEDPFRHPVHDPAYGREAERHRPAYEEGGGSLDRRQTVRVFTKAEENYCLSIVDGKVVLSRRDPADEFQHWIKDLRYSTKVKDEEGFPAFALVNKATGEALKHSVGATHPVRLIPYNPDYLDESVLWTESRDLGDGFRCIRMVNNIGLNFDAFHGDKNHGGVHDGTTLVLWEWLKGENQRWKIVPY